MLRKTLEVKPMYSVKALIKRILKYAKTYRVTIIISLLCAVIFEGLSLYVPRIIGNDMLSLFKPGFVISDLIWPITLAAIFIVFATIFGILMGRLLNVATYKMIKDIRIDTFNKLLTLPVSYLDSHLHGDILTRVTSDVDRVWDGLLHGFTHIFRGFVAIIITIIFMFITKWDIALVVVLLTPLSMVVAVLVTKFSHKSFVKQAEVNGNMGGLINEMISEQKTVIAYNLMDDNENRFNHVSNDLTKVSIRAQFVSSLSRPTTRFANAIIYAIVVAYGLVTVIREPSVMNVGVVSTFLFYASQYTRPFNEIADVTTELSNSFACLKRVFELIDAKDLIRLSATKDVEVTRGEYEVNHVNFSYDKKRAILKDINFKALSGKHVALVGPTGCGKTTMINLLMRFYDADSGEIKLEGENILNISRPSLRQSVGMVLQDTWLFKGTVRDNIRYAKLDATDDEVEVAAIASNAHDFIMKLPKGYDTIIDDDDGISIGQKQLICIARLMLVLPKVLILDEATSNIDTRTEVNIQKAFKTLMDGRTSIVIAHRLSTIRHSDLILVMRNGEIIERGNHEELIKLGGFYKKLYDTK